MSGLAEVVPSHLYVPVKRLMCIFFKVSVVLNFPVQPRSVCLNQIIAF